MAVFVAEGEEVASVNMVRKCLQNKSIFDINK